MRPERGYGAEPLPAVMGPLLQDGACCGWSLDTAALRSVAVVLASFREECTVSRYFPMQN
jgi:hypothetical protein